MTRLTRPIAVTFLHHVTYRLTIALVFCFCLTQTAPRLSCAAANCEVRGKILGLDGKPSSETLVRLVGTSRSNVDVTDWNTVTDSQGRFVAGFGGDSLAAQAERDEQTRNLPNSFLIANPPKSDLIGLFSF